MGLTYSGVTVCSEFTGTLGDYCLDLEVIGVAKIACGPDFQAMCNELARLDGQYLLWSSFLAFVSHFYLVSATGYACHQRRSIPAILALYHTGPTTIFKRSNEGQAGVLLKKEEQPFTSSYDQPSDSSPETHPEVPAPMPVRGTSLLTGGGPMSS